ncbi:MAG: hypothetical protein A2014_10565 [Spirochaetes bacterium GWF1_49_6]|nr:MAG: hypothetical protein A2014_10565 [Spirochaetes bacterium GWF1_49_6]
MIPITEIEHIKDIIVRLYQPEKIVIFGSYARGEQDVNSDIDILVISDREKNIPHYKRGLEVRVALSEVMIEKDILFYTNSEVRKSAELSSSFISRAIKEGKIIYEREAERIGI